jgi:hypothetical protein
LIEADFQREYGMDLNEATDRLSWRRISALIAGLSGESRFVAALDGPQRVSGEAADRYLLGLVPEE